MVHERRESAKVAENGRLDQSGAKVLCQDFYQSATENRVKRPQIVTISSTVLYVLHDENVQAGPKGHDRKVPTYGLSPGINPSCETP